MAGTKKTYIYAAAIAVLVLLMLGLCFSECTPSSSNAPDGPAQCIDTFMSAMSENNETAALDCLYNCDSLGMMPVDELSYPEIYSELNEGRRWNILHVEHLSSTLCVVTVNFSYLDLGLYQEALTELVLEEKEKHLITSDEDYDEIIASCMQQLQGELKACYTTKALDIELLYSGNKWRILLSNELYSVLMGENQTKG